MEQLNNNFNFFVDEVTLEKAGKDENGKDIMKIGGIASTKAKDSDGEEIDEKGWDTEYFVNSGFFNYNHQSKFNPKAVIGEPTMAKVTKDGVYVEGFLYADSELAQSVYETTKMLESSSGKRRMGFSIEGKALERDPFNPKKIKKARLTGCALTLNPKNPNTLVNLLKGEDVKGYEDYVYEEEQVGADLAKSEDYIVCLEKDGKKIQIDKNLNIKISEISKDLDKAMSTANAGMTTVEDVDQDVKNRIDPSKRSKNLTKGEVYSNIFDYISAVDLEKAEMMYQIIEATATKRIQMENNIDNVENPQITKDDLQKSLDIVMGVVSSDNADELVKGKTKKSEDESEESYEDKMEKAKSEDEEYQALKKACDTSKKALEDYESKMEKGEISGYPARPASKDETMQSDENASTIGKEGDFIKKGDEDADEPENGKPEQDPEAGEESEEDVEKGKKLKKSMDDDLGIPSAFDAGELMKSVDATVAKSIAPVADLMAKLTSATSSLLEKSENLEKGIEAVTNENDELRKSLEGALETIEEIGNTPIPSKTVTSNNYMHHPSLEKSMDAGASQLHVVKDKNQILDVLDRKADLGGANPNMRYAQAMQHLESSNLMEKGIADDLFKSEGIQIVGL